jgi:glycosyltransferase involved in cell wall biosynthesis
MNPSHSIILPVYNEELCIREVLEEILQTDGLVDFEVVAVNDGSTDQTLNILNGLAAEDPRVRVVDLGKNCGQSIAFLAGFREARGEILITMDADGQNDPADIPRLLQELKGRDCVLGYREKRKDTLSKRWGSRMANAVRSRILRDGVRDTGCAVKVFRASLASNLPPWNGIHRFFPAFFLMEGATLHQVSVNHRPRSAGTSKYTNLGRLKRTIRDLFGVRLLQQRYVPIPVLPEKQEG